MKVKSTGSAPADMGKSLPPPRNPNAGAIALARSIGKLASAAAGAYATAGDVMRARFDVAGVADARLREVMKAIEQSGDTLMSVIHDMTTGYLTNGNG